MNIILHELRRSLKGLVIWCAGIILLVSGASTELVSLQNMAFDMGSLMKMFPESMYKALSFDLISFNTAGGYFSYMGEYLMMLGAIYAVLAGTNIISKELRKRTSEILFTMPVSRSRITRMKLYAAIIDCVLFSSVLYAASLLTFMRFDPDPAFFTRLPVFFLSMFTVQLLFLSGGFLISTLSTYHKRTGMIGAGITMALYVLTFLINLDESLSFLTYVTPFEFFSSVSIMRGDPIGLYGIIMTACLIVCFLLISLLGIRRKDIYC